MNKRKNKEKDPQYENTESINIFIKTQIKFVVKSSD